MAGKVCAEMCAAAAKVDPVLSYKKFIPACTSAIERILEGKQLLLDKK